MKVIYAKEYGFCMGVTRAAKLMEDVLTAPENSHHQVWTMGPLIHNEIFMQKMEERGVKIAAEDSPIGPNDIVVLRTHGLAPTKIENLSTKSNHLIDATCPKVRHSQKLITDFIQSNPTGLVLIAGDRNHGEVEALCGFAPNAVVLQDEKEAAAWAESRLKEKNRTYLDQPILLLAQTTFNPSLFSSIQNALYKAGLSNIEVKSTICKATEMRQSALKELVPQVDVVIVVGGKQSANTRRLAEISERAGKETYLIQSAADLNIEIKERLCIQSAGNPNFAVGITAGASTPQWVIEAVEAELLAIK